MRNILHIILLTVFLVCTLLGRGIASAAQEEIYLAQNMPDIELPKLPEPPTLLAPPAIDKEEKKSNGDKVLPTLPEAPPLPVADQTEKKEIPASPPKDAPLAPAVPLEPVNKKADIEEMFPPPPNISDEMAQPPGPVAPKPSTPATQPTIQEVAIGKSKAAASNACAPLPGKLEACEKFGCKYTSFDKDSPDFIKGWNVERKDGEFCLYHEAMPHNATLQCRLSAKSRNAFAAYLRALLIQRKPLSDQNILSVYTKAQKEECQIVGEDGEIIAPEIYRVISNMPANVVDYGASDAPKGDCETLNEKLKSCEQFYCKGNDPVQEKYFNRKIEIERKIIGWMNGSCIYVQKSAGKNLVGCKYTKADSTTASQCSTTILTEIAKEGTLFNKLTLAEKAASGEATLIKPEEAKEEAETEIIDTRKKALMQLSEHNYKTQLLPNIIYKKQYDKQNKDLPVAYYPSEFKTMAFTALDRNDLVALRAFIAKIEEIDTQLRKQKKKPLGGIETRDSHGNTLLIRSVMAGNFMAARMLIGEGADIDAKNHSGVTPLQAAAYIGREDLVTLLLGVGAKRDIADKYGRTALSHSIERNFPAISALLLRHKADANTTSGMAIPPLITAAKLGNISTINLLLDNKANINSRDSERKTALMYAAESGQMEVVKLLLARGADISLQDKTGRTAETLATNAGHIGIAQILASAAIDKRLHR